MTRTTFALMTTALASVAAMALAQDRSGENLSTTVAAPEEISAAETLAMAQALYGTGIASGDALTVLTAARLAASAETDAKDPAALDPARVGLTEATPTAKRRADPAAPAAPAPMMAGEERPAAVATFAAATSDEEGAGAAPVTSVAMFATATELAAGDEVMLGLIEDAMAEGSRGRIGGAVTWESRLQAGRVDVWEVPFYGNSYAEVAVVGDGDTDLDVLVTDENGNVICYDVSRSDQVYCDFVPAWDGYFYVTVENTGGVRNTYYLLTN